MGCDDAYEPLSPQDQKLVNDKIKAIEEAASARVREYVSQVKAKLDAGARMKMDDMISAIMVQNSPIREEVREAVRSVAFDPEYDYTVEDRLLTRRQPRSTV